MKVGSEFLKNDYPLSKCLITDDTIGKCNSEKGSKAHYIDTVADWDPQSLFGLISRQGESTNSGDEFTGADILVCDDMGAEIADFIMCDENRPRVVFIHAKASSTQHYCSASALHDVCAQAVKNLGYLAMFNDFPPPKLDRWGESWEVTIQNRKCKVGRRIRLGSKNPEELWQRIRKCINDPMVEKEVWLFTGNILSKTKFEEELDKEKPPSNAIQAAYLLHATMSDVASVGAKLKIFCAE